MKAQLQVFNTLSLVAVVAGGLPVLCMELFTLALAVVLADTALQ
jgi:hypothetical protein